MSGKFLRNVQISGQEMEQIRQMLLNKTLQVVFSTSQEIKRVHIEKVVYKRDIIDLILIRGKEENGAKYKTFLDISHARDLVTNGRCSFVGLDLESLEGELEIIYTLV